MSRSDVAAAQRPDPAEPPRRAAASGHSSTDATGPPRPPARLRATGLARWAWRRLTKMSTAIVLLAIVALAAIPGGVLPQRNRDAAEVASYIRQHPGVGPVLDRLGMFSVFTSPWFVACYLLLFISLVGCIVPRCRKYARALASPPPALPVHLERFETYRKVEVARSPVAAVDALAAGTWRPYRVARSNGAEPDADAANGDSAPGLVAFRGRLREAGNLTFHIGLVACLIALTVGQAFAHSGQIVLVEGQSAANALVDYDSFDSGVLFDPARLEPFTVRLDTLTARFAADGRADFYQADVTLRDRGQVNTAHIRVNAPARVGGTSIYLMGNGYAPHVTVTGADGVVAFSGPVPFLAAGGSYTLDGVIKVPDIVGERQLGLTGQLYPSAVDTGSGYVSVRPEATNPRLVLTAYAGDLGLDSGVPQNVYQLDTAKLTRIGAAGQSIDIGVGQVAALPDNVGTIRFDSLSRYAALDLTANPGAAWLLAAVLVATMGLIVSLFTPRRRLFARAWTGGAGAIVEIAGDSEQSDAGLSADVDRLERVLEPLRLRDAASREEMGTNSAAARGEGPT